MLVVTSRDANNTLRMEVLNLGGYDVLAKPLNEEEMKRAVSGALRRWQPQHACKLPYASPTTLSSAVSEVRVAWAFP